MKNQSKSDLPAQLAQGRQCFERWRKKQKRRTRLPEHLWALAAKLAREFGVNRTARTLRLDYYCLKTRMETPISDDTSPAGPQTQFLELLPVVSQSTIECAIECENAQGAKIHIHLKGHDLSGLASLCGELWSHQQ